MKKAIPSFLLILILHYPTLAQTDLIGAGRAIQFDGINDYIDLGNVYDDITLPLSISAWVYVEPSSKYMLPVFASQDNAPLYNGFWFCLTASNLFFEYGDGKGDQNAAFRRGKSAVVSNLQGRWVHVSAVVKSRNDIQLYVNGHNVGGDYTGFSDLPMASNYPNDFAKIGYFFTNSATHRFYGFMDELRIWNRALSEYEVREMMCRRLVGNETGLIGYWNFDETSGDVVKDLSAKGYNGTVLGGTTRVYSAAPIGDESVFVYTTNWSGTSLSQEDLTVAEVSGTVYGVQTYIVNNVPSQTGGLDITTIQPKYYGIFLADDGAVNTFNFNFTEGVVCKFYRRNDNSVANWQPSETLAGIPTRLEIIPTFETAELVVDLGPDVSFCGENSYLLEAQAEPGVTFLWNTGETSPAITVSASGKFAVEARMGCQVGADSIRISFLSPPPDFSLGPDEFLCTAEPRLLMAELPEDDYDFTWQDGSKQPHYRATEFGNYWLKIQNACGVAVDSITFAQKPLKDFNFYNFMSPDNHDGLNQYFVVDGLLQGSRFTVYNRWGKPLYNSSNYQNNWDGDGIPAGIYFYTIEGECFEPIKGTVTITR